MTLSSMSQDRAKWLQAMSECLAAVEREQMGSPCPVVDHELIASPASAPDDMYVWCICRTAEEKRLFRDTEYSRFVSTLRKRMIQAKFPESAVTSLATGITSREEIEARGGRFDFAR